MKDWGPRAITRICDRCSTHVNYSELVCLLCFERRDIKFIFRQLQFGCLKQLKCRNPLEFSISLSLPEFSQKRTYEKPTLETLASYWFRKSAPNLEEHLNSVLFPNIFRPLLSCTKLQFYPLRVLGILIRFLKQLAFSYNNHE